MGRNTFTLEPRFRERFPLNRRALKDAFHTVDRGEVTKAKRKTRGGNIHRVITVRPDGNGDVTITLPETADCDAGGPSARRTAGCCPQFRTKFKTAGVPATQTPPAKPIPQSKFDEIAKKAAGTKARKSRNARTARERNPFGLF